MTKFQTDFLPIPFMAIQDDKLNQASRMVLGLIYYITEKRGDKFFMSNKYISDILHFSTGTIQNALTMLENNGYVKRIFKDEKKRIRSEILCGIKVTKVSLVDDIGITQKGHEVSHTSEQNKINNKEISNKSEEESFSQLKRLFDTVRVSYKQKLKGKARGIDTEFANADKKHTLTPELIERMFNGASRMYAEKLKEYPDGDFQYVPMFQTFINNSQWEMYEKE